MSVKTHEPVCIDAAQDLYFWFDHFLGDQIKDEWDTSFTGAGSFAVVDAQTGGIGRLTTGGLDNNNSSVDWNNIRSLHIDKKVTLEFRMIPSTVSSIRFLVYLYFDFNNFVGFEFDTDNGDTKYRILTENGGASTDLDSGITADVAYHVFRIECFPTGEVHYYIDGVETDNSPITTNIPNDAGDFLQPILFIQTREAAIKSMDIDYVVVRQER